MIVTLEEAKLFLRVDGDEEDDLITKLLLTSQDLCEGVLRYSLSEFEEVPEIVRESILYSAANMYENRDNFNSKEIIETISRLLFGYRKEEW